MIAQVISQVILQVVILQVQVQVRVWQVSGVAGQVRQVHSRGGAEVVQR